MYNFINLRKPDYQANYKMSVKNDVADIYIYDQIGIWGVEAQSFVRELSQITAAQINLHINSPGGDVFDGLAIFNALKQKNAKITAYIEGLAASMGSIIPLAADKVVMAENAMFMIHDPWTICVGNSRDLRARADHLDVINANLLKIYTSKSSLSSDDIKTAMAAETWYTAEEALEAGFIDEITDFSDIQDGFNLDVYDNCPDHLRTQAKDQPNEVADEDDLEQTESDGMMTVTGQQKSRLRLLTMDVAA